MMDYTCTYNGERTLDMIGIFILSPEIQSFWCATSAAVRLLNHSNRPKKGNLDEKPTRRHYSPEEDKRHVSVHGKNRSSLKHIAEILDGSINSVIDRCLTWLCREYKSNGNDIL